MGGVFAAKGKAREEQCMAEVKTDFGPLEGQLEAVRERQLGKHAGEEIEYATCCQNGCFDMCLLK